MKLRQNEANVLQFKSFLCDLWKQVSLTKIKISDPDVSSLRAMNIVNHYISFTF